MTHRFVTSCVDANGDDINEMVDLALRTEMSNSYFIRKLAPKLGIDQQVMEMLGYDSKEFFANDWAMNCSRSYYQGVECVYVQHSRIEYIFVDSKDMSKMLDLEDAARRQIRISALEDDLYEMLDKFPSTDKGYYKLAEAFYAKHKDDLDEHRIPLTVFSRHSCPFNKAFVIFDKKNYLKTTEKDNSPSLR